ncbi:MAG TPA: hypothetical protein VKG05_14070 [Steroidobacteraceae bacterium]|nr:hypothetical protein [Steroidobacteraceae bacterium]
MRRNAKSRGAVEAAVRSAAVLGIMAALAVSAAPAQAPGGPGAATPGVENPRRAWQDWTLNCQGCHRPDGHGSAGAAPDIAGSVARFLRVDGGRDYLGRVPGVATSPLSSRDLAEVLNWMLWRFDPADIPANFQPFTAEEIDRLRTRPLRNEASQVRRELLKKIDRTPIR